MNQQWTLHIENFAQIKSADIRISPLILFVGDNNSGKSYVMSLLWGLLTYGKDFFPANPSEALAYKSCERKISENIQQNFELSADDISLFINWFNHILVTSSKQLVKKIFNYDVEVGKIEIKDYIGGKWNVKWRDGAERYSTSGNTLMFPTKEKLTREDYLKIFDLCNCLSCGSCPGGLLGFNRSI